MFEMKREITYSQVRKDLKVDMAEIAQFFQDCVLYQSETIGKGIEETNRTHTAWFLSSWQIEVLRYPAFMESVTVRTWPHSFKSMYGYRNFDVLDRDGRVIARANSIWIFMDLENMSPAKPTEENLRGYEIEPAIEMEYAPRKIKILDACFEEDLEDGEAVKVRHTFLDSNRHVNNGRYVKEAMNYLPDGISFHQMRVDYRKAATLGDVLYPKRYHSGDMYQLVFADEMGSPYVIVEIV